MLKLSYASYLGISLAISAQLTFKLCVAGRNRKKFTKTFNFGGSRSRSFKVITSACYDSQHVCAYL